MSSPTAGVPIIPEIESGAGTDRPRVYGGPKKPRELYCSSSFSSSMPRARIRESKRSSLYVLTGPFGERSHHCRFVMLNYLFHAGSFWHFLDRLHFAGKTKQVKARRISSD
jgi:hypothetical protein